MDWSSLGGLVLALIGILLGQAIEGGQISSLIQPAALLIVMCGTFGAVLLQSNTASFIAGLKMVRQVFSPPLDDRQALANRIILWSNFARKEGIFMLETYLKKETDPFIQKGLKLMIDGTPPEKIRQVIAIDMHFFEIQERNAAKIWSAAGGYAPTVGILGAVLGLIHVMENLSDPSRLGSGIAVAFVATIYGVGLANLVFLPVSNKLKSLIQHEMMRREMLLNAWVSIASGDHPRVVEERLLAYLR
ncbi:flagellar motor protein [Methylotenera versatilis]|uniref:MotA/TolQ/ExbB proton channel n=1 Tax=Methylotenera versatilis (strain 301) TaxID=666681 RepID=D7DJ44_METV0|nr:flagellar motor protein [Methylotenera versatilis]ADI30079.1 MotA/TolQ/ExbB proton channel [Methylotenera versatilis 301]